MHGKHRNAGVDNVHAVLRRDVGDGSAATCIYLAQLGGLERDIGVVHHAAHVGHVFRARIVRAALAARTRVLVEHQALAKVGGVLRLEHRGVGRVEAGGNVAREHARCAQAMAQGKGTGALGKLDDFRNGVLEELRGHAGSAHAADLLLVYQHAHCRLLRRGYRQLSFQGSVSAHAVVLAVAQHHAAVEAELAGAAGRHYLDLGGKEVFFLDAVLFLQQLQCEGLHRFLGCGLFLVGGIFLVLDNQGAVADEHIEAFAFHNLAALLRHLLVAQMRQQVGYAEHRVALIVAHVHVYHRAVGLRHNAVQGQRQGYPLVVLDAAVVMGVQEGESVAFVHRVLLQVQTGAVDMGAQDVQARVQRLGADAGKNERLAVHASPHLAARLQGRACRKRFRKRLVASSFGLRYRGGKAAALGFVVGNEIDVAGGKRIQLFKLGIAVLFPCNLVFHAEPPSLGVCLSPRRIARQGFSSASPCGLRRAETKKGRPLSRPPLNVALKAYANRTGITASPCPQQQGCRR